MNDQQRLIAALRAWLELKPEHGISDDEVLRVTDGTFGRARIELGIATSDCWKAIMESHPVIRWVFRPLFCVMFRIVRIIHR